MKNYLLVYDPDLLVEGVIPDLVARNEKIGEAYSFFGNAVCIKTEAGLKHISEMIRSRYPDLQFVIVELEAAPKAGSMRPAFWSFLKERELEKPSA